PFRRSCHVVGVVTRSATKQQDVSPDTRPLRCPDTHRGGCPDTRLIRCPNGYSDWTSAPPASLWRKSVAGGGATARANRPWRVAPARTCWWIFEPSGMEFLADP